MNGEPVISREAERKVYENAFVTVFDDDVRFADGRPGRYVRIVEAGGKPGVAMLAVCGNAIALVRTYRYTVQRFEWGIPRGFGQNVDPDNSALAELTEELGAAPDRLEPVAVMSPNSGLLATNVHLYFAQYSRMSTTPNDGREVSVVRWIDWALLLDEIAAGEISDGFTLAAVGVATSRGLLPLPRG
ncbi:MAG TPA: NUDIX hydrolase [Mycobacteriales bacterium]|jgi:ADP-ribose pyrophosphatase|nr:NUDIX hydrolase [Mycobacteriales bacterium]